MSFVSFAYMTQSAAHSRTEGALWSRGRVPTTQSRRVTIRTDSLSAPSKKLRLTEADASKRSLLTRHHLPPSRVTLVEMTLSRSDCSSLAVCAKAASHLPSQPDSPLSVGIIPCLKSELAVLRRCCFFISNASALPKSLMRSPGFWLTDCC